MSATAAAHGRLVLVPNTLDLGTGETVDIQAVLPLGVLQRAATLTHWVAENAKTARAFLKRVDAVVPLAQPLQAVQITELPRPPKGRPTAPPAQDFKALLAPALAGHDLGLLSEAGLPALADPGADLVAAAHAAGVGVDALPGPSAIALALAASGLNGQSFAFVGYLPVDASARAARVKELEAWSRKCGQTQVAIETPYRNNALLQALLQHLQPGTRLAVACGLTLPAGFARTHTVAQWRKAPPTLGEQLPAVFSFLAT
jgi:16S rRNA (cytidine1402-2'-O)-methyltransferase